MGNGREHYETSIGFGYSRFTLHRGEEDGDGVVDVGCSQESKREEVLNGYR